MFGAGIAFLIMWILPDQEFISNQNVMENFQEKASGFQKIDRSGWIFVLIILCVTSLCWSFFLYAGLNTL
ncbi:MAG: hypothetical protein WA821_10965, partial [Anaerolineales bacterium]